MNKNKKEENNLDYKFALEQANRWIESADSKTGIALSLVSITFSIYAGFLLESHMLMLESDNRVLLIVFTMASFFVFGLAIYFFIRTIIPRLTKPFSNNNPFYYAEVSTYNDVDTFTNKFMGEYSENEQRLSILQSLYFNSKIANKKMKGFYTGLIFSALYFMLSIATIIIALFTMTSGC